MLKLVVKSEKVVFSISVLMTCQTAPLSVERSSSYELTAEPVAGAFQLRLTTMLPDEVLAVKPVGVSGGVLVV